MIIDELIKRFQQCELNDDFRPWYVFINGQPMRGSGGISYENESTTGGGDYGGFSRSSAFHHHHHHKRVLAHSPTSDDEDNNGNGNGNGNSKKSHHPNNNKSVDFYKQRQFKKFLKNPTTS